MAGAHLHNTRGQGLANVVAAFEVHVTTFDSSPGGLGGCPYAAGATGNIVTEDLVFMLEATGLWSGVDIDALIAAREVLLRGLPGEARFKGMCLRLACLRGLATPGKGALHELCAMLSDIIREPPASVLRRLQEVSRLSIDW